MSKIHHCEFCGKIGATKTHVVGTDYSGTFYLCESCSALSEEFSIPGKTRGELLNEVYQITDLHYNGPKSSALTRDRTEWEFISLCSCCSRKVGTHDGLNFDEEIVVTPLIKGSLPSNLRNSKFTFLCHRCIEALQIKMISKIPMDKLPLMVNTKEFCGPEGDEWEFLNDDLKGLVSKKLQGLPLEKVLSLSSAKILKCLDVSLDYLTEEDRLLFKKDGEIETRTEGAKQYDTLSDANPLIIAEYEHGYMIELDIDFPEGFTDFMKYMKKFGYTNKFCDIISNAIKYEYDYIRFDTIGPKYKEFEKSVI